MYETDPQRNTGIDPLLEVSRWPYSLDGATPKLAESRAVLNFDWDHVNLTLANLAKDHSEVDWKLKLTVADATQIPVDYTIECYVVAQAWDMGVGRKIHTPATTGSVSWYNAQNDPFNYRPWRTGSLNSGEAALWTAVGGGGVWLKSEVSTYTFNYQHSNPSFDMERLISSAIKDRNEEGFIIKVGGDPLPAVESLKMFSVDTTTVFSPILELSYNDQSSAGTLTAMGVTDDRSVIAHNLKPTYGENEMAVLRFSSRPRYPVQTWATGSRYLDRYVENSLMGYEIRDAHSDHVIIPASEATLLSDDANGNYVTIAMSNFQPERAYRLVLKDTDTRKLGPHIVDNNWIFRIQRQGE